LNNTQRSGVVTGVKELSACIVCRHAFNALSIVCFQPFDIGEHYCGQHDINHPVVGTVPLSRDAAITWSDVTVTSLAVTVTTAEYTVAFVAMDDGTVRKVRSSTSQHTPFIFVFGFLCFLFSLIDLINM